MAGAVKISGAISSSRLQRGLHPALNKPFRLPVCGSVASALDIDLYSVFLLVDVSVTVAIISDIGGPGGR